MRKFFLLLALMACSLTYAATTVLIDGLYYSLGTSSATVLADQSSGKTVYSAYTSVTIPASVTYEATTYPVTTIGTSAFESMSNLESVVLPSSITAINTDAFYGCTKLSHVNLHEGIETISLRAFYNCKLTEVTIPSTVTSIGNGAFKGNPIVSITWLPAECSTGSDSDAPFYSTSSQVTSFTFGENVVTVPWYICKNMSQLDTVVLPPSVRALGQNAFQYCTSLKYINLPVTQKTLPISFLEGCSALDSIHLPATLTTISTDAFYGCTKLSKVNIDEGLETIGTRAFYNCKLTEVTIPSTVTTIGNGAFKGNPTVSITWLPAECSTGSDSDAPFYSTSSQVTSFTFGENVVTVPWYICKNMSKLDTVVLPPSVKSLGSNAFQYCTSLKYINLPVTQKTLPVSFLEGCTALDSIHLPATLTTISTDVFYGCSKLSKVNLDEGLVTIGTRAFNGCNLKDITIPSTVTSIGNGAFKGNPTVSITWLPAECSIGSDSDAPFYSTSSQVTSFTFGDSVKVVPPYLCKNMSKVETIVLPPAVTSVGHRAFMYCTALKALEFPQGITTVAVSVLEGCTALETLIIPSTVATINQDAFYGCKGLQAIYNYAVTPQSITERVVNNVDKTTCALYVPAASFDLYADAPVWKDFLRKEIPTVYYEFSEAACDSFIWNDKTYKQSQDIVETYKIWKEEQRTDSIVTMHLTINHSNAGEEYQTAEGSYQWHGVTYTESGDYQFTLTNVAGCDSVATLHLTITLPPVYYEFSETACDEFTWNQKTYTVSQDVVETFKAVTGQDSIVTMHLTINHSNAGEEYQTAEGSYQWHGETYTESGDYQFTLTNVAGCDSVATLHLTVIPLWQVTVLSPANGSIALQETGIDLTKVKDGTMLHFIATPDEGYLFEAWSGCNEDGSLLVTANAIVTCTFVAEPVTALDPIHDGANATKILRDGNLFIRQGDKTYTVTGKEVR